MSVRSFFVLGFLFMFLCSRATQPLQQKVIVNLDEIRALLEENVAMHEQDRPLPVILKSKKDLGRKFTAALLAFPFPFGIVGLHRIYLGCAPYIPVVYIATLGGVFGLLPLIDCIVILLDKDPEHYVNNNKVFMWVN